MLATPVPTHLLRQAVAGELPYRVGISVQNITPCPDNLIGKCPADSIRVHTDKLHLCGYKDRRAQAIDTPLSARALALADAEGHRAVLVNVDVTSL
jgi:hypothetical protein